MAGTIFTPITLWKDFKIDGAPQAETVRFKKEGNVQFEKVFIDGRVTKEGQVKIFGILAHNVKNKTAPAILLVQDFKNGLDERIIKDLASRGYIVLAIDLAGKENEKEDYTFYPEDVSYADYVNAVKGCPSHEGDTNMGLYDVEDEGGVDKTCWYEWTAVCKYAFQYLKNLPSVTRVGGFAIAEAATVMWQLAATESDLAGVTFVLNAGWMGYRGIHKFAGTVEPQFSDNMYKILAGVEAQAYAMHVKCPVLMLSATNSNLYPCDRVYDTVSRVENNVYKAVHYSTSYRDRISGGGYQNMLYFFEEILIKGGNGKDTLPEEMDIKCELIDGKIVIKVKPDQKQLGKIRVFVAEETVEPSLRAWQRVSEYKKKGDEYVFEYLPHPQSGIVTAFAKADYKNGFAIVSNVVAKRFEAEEVINVHKSNIIYSSRIKDLDSLFTAENQKGDNPDHINIWEKKRVKVKKGPMGIEGVSCEWGLMTFKINAFKDKPTDGSMLMFDVCSNEPVTVMVKLTADYFGKSTEYLSTSFIQGGDVWYNIKIEQSKFKTAEGMALKSFDKINSLAFIAEDGKEFIINNALWV